MPYESRNDLLSHKLTEKEVEELIKLRKQGVTLKTLANQFGVHQNTVRNVIKRAKASGDWQSS